MRATDEVGVGPVRTALGTSTAIVERCEHFALLRRFEGVRLADLCRVGHASERRVRDAFHEVRGAAPVEWLRRLALDEVHAMLVRVEPTSASVTDVAASHGFTHVSRFAAEYRKRFGENPSRTLRTACPQALAEAMVSAPVESPISHDALTARAPIDGAR
jgi:AraC-like DNA-binding protein